MRKNAKLENAGMTKCKNPGMLKVRGAARLVTGDQGSWITVRVTVMTEWLSRPLVRDG